MKILRSVNRRGFSIGSAGFFTILKPNTWFPATRLPARFSRARVGSGGAAEVSTRVADQNTPAQQRAMPSSYMKLIARDHRVMRPALIILAATAITLILLLWIAHPR
jgi:hypothetical protein